MQAAMWCIVQRDGSEDAECYSTCAWLVFWYFEFTMCFEVASSRVNYIISPFFTRDSHKANAQRKESM
jgi:hypothetical protein